MISGLSVNWFNFSKHHTALWGNFKICTTHLTAVRNLEHDDLTHKPSSIFALLMDMLCFFFVFVFGEHLHAMAIKSLPQSFQIIVVIMMERQSQSQWNFFFFPPIVITARTQIARTVRWILSHFTFIHFFLFV